MPRKPATMELAGGKGPRQRIWEAIRAARGEEFTRHGIALSSDVEDETVATYMRSLVAAGIVEIVRCEVKSNVSAKQVYRLARDEGVEAPRLRRDGSRVTQGLGQEAMWRMLRKTFGDTNARELAAYASTPTVTVAEAAAASYLQALHTAGYLLRIEEGHGLGKPGAGVQARYKLKRSADTGPRAPMICRTKVVFDPNQNRVVWAPVISDEDAIYER